MCQKRIEGSNPSVSARNETGPTGACFISDRSEGTSRTLRFDFERIGDPRESVQAHFAKQSYAGANPPVSVKTSPAVELSGAQSPAPGRVSLSLARPIRPDQASCNLSALMFDRGSRKPLVLRQPAACQVQVGCVGQSSTRYRDTMRWTGPLNQTLLDALS